MTARERPTGDQRTFDFAIAHRYAPLLLPLGVTGGRADVTVGPEGLVARFGFFRVTTELGNVLAAIVHEGPFNPLLAIGVRYSLSDRSITFGSSTDGMVEIQFRRPVPLTPPGITRHPALWVSVADPGALAAALSRNGPTPGDAEH